jgi:hypothetical protein
MASTRHSHDEHKTFSPGRRNPGDSWLALAGMLEQWITGWCNDLAENL